MPSPQSSSSIRSRGRTVRPSSFHGRLPGTPAAETSTLRRPKTVPDLHAARQSTIAASLSPSSSPATSSSTPPRVPAKVLVSITVLRSLGALQVVASTDWTVTQLVAAALRQYVKEGRRPLLPSGSDPDDYALHYSQFSLQPIPSEEKLINLGSRTFFLCPKHQPQQLQQQRTAMPLTARAAIVSPPPPPPHPSAPTCSSEEHRVRIHLHPKTPSSSRWPWLRFIDFLL